MAKKKNRKTTKIKKEPALYKLKSMLDYGIIGNCITSALVKKNASVEWMCFPVFDSPSIFAKMLDEKKGGSIEIIPAEKCRIRQHYIQNTAILETFFEGKKSAFVVQDFFPRYKKLAGKKHEKLVKENRLVRIIKPVKGKPVLKLIFEPKLDFAKGKTIKKTEKEKIVCNNGSFSIQLISNAPVKCIMQKKAFSLNSTNYFIIEEEKKENDFSVKKCQKLLRDTKRYWENWVKTLIMPEQYREHIIRSAITLKLLTYSKTGAMLAAATTSLPEVIGTNRCFDYRLCWIRDAAFCADTFTKIGRTYEPKKLIEFLIEIGMRDDHVQPIYGITGETKLKEISLPHLAGYKNSRPVRIGNASYNSLQLDIFGELIDLLYLYFGYFEFEKKMQKKHWHFLKFLVNQIKFNWHRKDSGVWEFRGLHNHYVHSKLLCFVGVDRAIRLAQQFRKDNLAEEWLPLREEIKQDILEKGYSKRKKAFTIAYNSPFLDAAVLLMSYHEFLENNDPRMINTVQAIFKGLKKGFLVKRYAMKDDFGKSTSALTLCSFWMIDSLYYIGEKQKAKEMFESLLKHSNHLGLFSEDMDTKTKNLTGNFPQAYTHLGVINSALLLSEWSARRKKIKWDSVPKRNNWF